MKDKTSFKATINDRFISKKMKKKHLFNYIQKIHRELTRLQKENKELNSALVSYAGDIFKIKKLKEEIQAEMAELKRNERQYLKESIFALCFGALFAAFAILLVRLIIRSII